jgi:hypothetical protein
MNRGSTPGSISLPPALPLRSCRRNLVPSLLAKSLPVGPPGRAAFRLESGAKFPFGFSTQTR